MSCNKNDLIKELDEFCTLCFKGSPAEVYLTLSSLLDKLMVYLKDNPSLSIKMVDYIKEISLAQGRNDLFKIADICSFEIKELLIKDC